MAKRVVFCFLYKFIDGDASGLRFYNLAMMFKKRGFDTTIIGFGDQDYKKRIVTNDGIEIYSIRKYKSKRFVFKVLNHLRDLYGVLNRFLIRLFPKVDIIVLPLHYPTRLLKKIRRKYTDAKIIFSAMEEDSMLKFYSMEDDYKNSDKIKLDKKITKFYLKNTYGFGITENLTERMNNIGINTLTVPFIFDKEYFLTEKKPHDKINFMYAGHPGTKDALMFILESFSLLAENELNKIHLHVVGVDEKWLLQENNGSKIFEKIKGFTTFYGYKPHSFVKQLYEIVDFSLLLRDPDSPVSKAGFPTKISESLFNQTPVICNITSDLSTILSENNSIIIEEYNVEETRKAINRAINLGKEKYNRMSKCAKETANLKLSTEVFADKILEFLYGK